MHRNASSSSMTHPAISAAATTNPRGSSSSMAKNNTTQPNIFTSSLNDSSIPLRQLKSSISRPLLAGSGSLSSFVNQPLPRNDVSPLPVLSSSSNFPFNLSIFPSATSGAQSTSPQVYPYTTAINSSSSIRNGNVNFGDLFPSDFSSVANVPRNYRSALKTRSYDATTCLGNDLACKIETPCEHLATQNNSTTISADSPATSVTQPQLGYGGYSSGYGGYGYGGYGTYGLGYRYGMMGGNYDDGSLFSQSVDTLSRFSQLLDMNSWFFDQICDTLVGITSRVRSIRSGLAWLPHRLADARQNGMAHVLSFLQQLDLLAPPRVPQLEKLPNSFDIKSVWLGHENRLKDRKGGRQFSRNSDNTEIHCVSSQQVSDVQVLSIYGELPQRVWSEHFQDAVKRLRLSITLCVGFLLLGLWRLFLLWRRRRRRTRSKMLLWDAFFGPTNRASVPPSSYTYRVSEAVNEKVLSAL